MSAATPPAHIAPAPPNLPAACSALAPAIVGRALGRPVNALSATLFGETPANRASHLANCVYSYDRAPYPVALTISVALPTGERPSSFQTDSRGGVVLSVHDPRFDLTLWAPDGAGQAVLTNLARAAYDGKEPAAPKEPLRWAVRAGERYVCELLSPADVARVVGAALSASATTTSECQYAAQNAPYRVVADVILEVKPPGTAFALQRIDDLRAASYIDVRSVKNLPFGHFIRPLHGPGALLLFDAGTQLVTVTTPDSSDRARLERLADIVRRALAH